MHTALDWIRAHALAAWVALTPLLLLVLRTRTAAQWVALGERLPRVAGAIKLLRGVGVDPVRVAEGALQALTGQRVPDPRELVIAAQAAQIADLEAALATYQRRVAAQTAVDVAEPFDASARQTLAPEVVAEAQRLTSKLHGRVPVGALLVLAGVGIVVAVVSVLAAAAR